MKYGKAAGTSLVVAEILNDAEVQRAQQIRDLIEDITNSRKIPTEWEESIIVYLYKGKGVALEWGNYRGLKLLDLVMEALERVAENKCALHHRCHIRCTPVKLHAINKTFYMAFVYLEKAFYHVTCHLVGSSQYWHGGVAGVACMKMAEAECILVATWGKRSMWKWVFT